MTVVKEGSIVRVNDKKGVVKGFEDELHFVIFDDNTSGKYEEDQLSVLVQVTFPNSLIFFSFGPISIHFTNEEDDGGWKFTIQCYSMWRDELSPYDLDDNLSYLEEKHKDLEFDSELSCFFAYTKSPEAVLDVVKGLSEQIEEIEYTDEEVELFKEVVKQYI